MYYLACINDAGKCFGFLLKDRTISTDLEADMGKLMSFKTKRETSEIVMQINLPHMLMANGIPYRVAAVKG